MGAKSEREMRDKAKAKYHEHYALVRRVTPPERLLEYKLGDGWKPLCEFLGVEIPDVPFPNINDSDAVWEQLAIVVRRGLMNAAWSAVWVCLLCLTAGVVYLAYARSYT